MILHKLCCISVLGFLTLALTPGVQRHSSRLTKAMQADGGRPVPPWPPSRTRSLNTAQVGSILRADGGRPVPPWPPSGTRSLNTAQVGSILRADGGRPVPPWPPGPAEKALSTYSKG
jgi:hypothetical protein